LSERLDKVGRIDPTGKPEQSLEGIFPFAADDNITSGMPMSPPGTTWVRAAITIRNRGKLF